ncbi:hypothetical protein [uncultured Hydrogenophaga sp.]|jgi:hypothetical protein|uniref:hypothetical protein n=1 Tax=uncultured Hydrogenophaga sp. TaxID=199683 RepID=UPI00258B3DC8|nr:hypothetical protein [uncultured Hydrogenophaga sp.]
MLLLGNLTKGLWEKFFDLLVGFVGAKYATRITAVTLLAAIYLSCVVTFTAWIGPLFGAIIGTTYGYLLGLLFPPIAGTIVAGVMLYRMCVVGVKYTSRLIKMAAGL